VVLSCSVDPSIFANMRGGVPAAVAAFFGTATYSLLNIVFIISSCAVSPQWCREIDSYPLT
jgi:hypothetical protein